MTTLIDTILAELKAKWNDTVITTADVDFLNAKINTKEKALPKIVVEEGINNLQIASLNLSANIQTTNFTIKCYHSSMSNVEKLVSETRRIIDAYSMAGGWWHVESVFFDQSDAIVIGYLTAQEKKFTTTAGWSYS
jgi:hypothetical protein